jgi:hypothetical protein
LSPFLVGLTPLQKLNEVLKDSHDSPDNPHQSEIAHCIDEEEKCYGQRVFETLQQWIDGQWDN